MTTLQIADLVTKLAAALTWPLVAFFFLVSFRNGILTLMQQGKVKFQLAGFEIEIPLSEFKQVMAESFRGGDLDDGQWQFLEAANRAPKHTVKKPEDFNFLRPLRDAGLIWAVPQGHLSNAKSIAISPLGRLLLQARSRQTEKRKSHDS